MDVESVPIRERNNANLPTCNSIGHKKYTITTAHFFGMVDSHTIS